jgi:tetratricopeptide (TPR) repeat protein
MRIARSLLVAICALGGGRAHAAPQASRPAPAPARPAPVERDKLDARALMQSGLKLFAAKDFLGALAVFKTAYARFASAKILLNIGTTLTRLDRKAEAANVYQRYLDSPDADPARRKDVTKALAELDAAVATLELAITPADAELQINDDAWAPAASPVRVAVGAVTLRARHAGYQPDEQVVQATAGGKLPVTIALAEIPPPVVEAPHTIYVNDGLRTSTAVEPARARIGVVALAHVDLSNGGGAGLVGVTADVTPRLQAQVAAILGPSSGGYAGASLAILDGSVRPILSAGVPVFASHGARIAIRAAAGLELALNRHLALIAELGVEYLTNPEADVERTLFVPAIGAAGRL